jgi:hypothetical protein
MFCDSHQHESPDSRLRQGTSSGPSGSRNPGWGAADHVEFVPTPALDADVSRRFTARDASQAFEPQAGSTLSQVMLSPIDREIKLGISVVCAHPCFIHTDAGRRFGARFEQVVIFQEIQRLATFRASDRRTLRSRFRLSGATVGAVATLCVPCSGAQPKNDEERLHLFLQTGSSLQC